MENLLEAAHQNLVDTIRRRVQYANGLWVEGDGWQLYDIGTDTADSHLRGATLGADADAATLLEELESRGYLEGEAVPLRVHPRAFDRVRPLLEQRGFACAEEAGYPIMAITRPVSRELAHTVQLVPLDPIGEDVAAEAIDTLRSAFTSLTQSDAEKMMCTGAWTSDPGLRLAVIRDAQSGRIVCAGKLTRTQDSPVAGLYYISTDSHERGKGYAKDLCTVLTNHAFEGGAQAVILQASTLGEFVYRHLGYEEIGRYYPFSRP